ncbi:MAG: PA14 domain-containing protein, partial [bacterium]
SGEVFARTPDESKQLSVGEAPKNAGNQYVARIRGFIEAPETGEYELAIASDDDSILFLGTSDDPATLVEIAHVEGYSNPGEYDGQPAQRSKPVQLEKGRRYAIQALHAEGGGGDHCSMMWRLPSGRVEAPIGAAPINRSEFPHLRRAIESCLAEGSAETAGLLCDIALSPANPMPMRVEALEALAAWRDGAPRNRVNGAYRVLDVAARNTDAAKAAFASTLARKLAPLAENPDPTVRSIARDVATKYGVSLDPEAALRAVSDSSLSAAERISSLRSLVGDKGGRLRTAIDAALTANAPDLRAEARTLLVETKDARALATLADAAEHGQTIERQRAIRDLGALGAASDTALAPIAQQLVDGTLDPALRLDIVEAGSARTDGPVATALERWKSSLSGDTMLRYETLALEGGDASLGRSVVLYHMSAVCMKCHAIAGSGVAAA